MHNIVINVNDRVTTCDVNVRELWDISLWGDSRVVGLGLNPTAGCLAATPPRKATAYQLDLLLPSET